MRRNEGVCQGADAYRTLSRQERWEQTKAKMRFLAQKEQLRVVRYQRKESKFVINKIGI